MLTAEIVIKKLRYSLPEVWPLAESTKHLKGIISTRTIRDQIQRGIGPEFVRSYGARGKIILEKDSFTSWLLARMKGPHGISDAAKL